MLHIYLHYCCCCCSSAGLGGTTPINPSKLDFILLSSSVPRSSHREERRGNALLELLLAIVVHLLLDHLLVVLPVLLLLLVHPLSALANLLDVRLGRRIPTLLLHSHRPQFSSSSSQEAAKRTLTKDPNAAEIHPATPDEADCLSASHLSTKVFFAFASASA